MIVRQIEDTPDLPANFALVSACSYEEGLANMVDALKQKDTNLAVWNGAETLIPDQIKASIEDKVSSLKSTVWRRNDYDSGLRKLNRLFRSKASAESILQSRQQACAKRIFNDLAYYNILEPEELSYISKSRLSLMQAWENTNGLKEARFEDRLMFQNNSPNYHFDFISKRNYVTFRTFAGSATYFIDEADRDYFTPPVAPVFNTSYSINDPEKITIWSPKNWAIAMMGHEDSFNEFEIHSHPYPDPSKQEEPAGRYLELCVFKAYP